MEDIKWRKCWHIDWLIQQVCPKREKNSFTQYICVYISIIHVAGIFLTFGANMLILTKCVTQFPLFHGLHFELCHADQSCMTHIKTMWNGWYSSVLINATSKLILRTTLPKILTLFEKKLKNLNFGGPPFSMFLIYSKTIKFYLKWKKCIH